jgi:hypothetical protein
VDELPIKSTLPRVESLLTELDSSHSPSWDRGNNHNHITEKSGSIGELLKRRKKKGGRVKSEILGIISIMILTVFLL